MQQQPEGKLFGFNANQWLGLKYWHGRYTELTAPIYTLRATQASIAPLKQ